MSVLAVKLYLLLPTLSADLRGIFPQFNCLTQFWIVNTHLTGGEGKIDFFSIIEYSFNSHNHKVSTL